MVVNCYGNVVNEMGHVDEWHSEQNDDDVNRFNAFKSGVELNATVNLTNAINQAG